MSGAGLGQERAGVLLFRGRVKLSRALHACFVLLTLWAFSAGAAPREVPRMLCPLGSPAQPSLGLVAAVPRSRLGTREN